jgi:regulator of replication initiation timing
MSTTTFYARRASVRAGGGTGGDPSTSDAFGFDDVDYDDVTKAVVDDVIDDDYDSVDVDVARAMMMDELRTTRARMAKLDASHRARTVKGETRRRREAEESASAAVRADATRLRANAARAERRMEEATEAERQLRVQNGDLRRKLERCANENKRLVMELGRLKEKLATRRRGTGTTTTSVGSLTTSSAPDAHVSMEYHEAVMRGFDKKVAALIDEIESLRRDGCGSRTSQIEPTPTTPSNERQRLQTNDDDGNHQNDENAFPPSPFSPNLAPLNALLDKLSAVNAHVSRKN